MRQEFPTEMGVLDHLVMWLKGRGYTELEGLCPCCPQQVGGYTQSGSVFYYRFRHGNGCLIADRAARDVDELIERDLKGMAEFRLTWEGEHDGWDSVDSAIAKFNEMEVWETPLKNEGVNDGR